MKQKLSIMLNLQDAMNSKVNPEWLAAHNPWLRAIWMECAELVDHHGWKWWKNWETNLSQIQMEIVDIWHFALSLMIESHLYQMPDSNIEALAERLAEGIKEIGTEETDLKHYTPVSFAEALASRALSQDQPGFDLQVFMLLMKSAEMDFDKLFEMYVGKNVLNFFRQENGYKDGSYIKDWDGREDNEHLMEIMLEITPDTENYPDALKAGLFVRYEGLQAYKDRQCDPA